MIVNMRLIFPNTAVKQVTRSFKKFVCYNVDFDIPHYIDETVFPKERRRLPVLDKQPFNSDRTILYPKMPKYTSGLEVVHNTLQHKQFGVQALEGGMMHFGHLEAIRLHVNRNISEDRMFAIWRIDSPWKPMYRHGIGKTLGGGKGKIKQYVTPLKTDRIILELGGYLSWQEAFSILKNMVKLLPLRCRFVSQEMLDHERKMAVFTERHNVNPFNIAYCLQHNLLDCNNFLSPYAKYYGRDYKP